MEQIRLNKFLSEMGVCSRREADRLIQEGNVLVDGEKAQMGMKINAKQEIWCNGKRIHTDAKMPEPVLLVVNKPRGIVCTTSDRDRAKNIVELINYHERIYPVGRLDKDSEGLILMTNQGELVNKIMRSGNKHEKEYIVTVDKTLTESFCKQMRRGVFLEDLNKTTLPCKMEQIDKHIFRIVLTQGLNRQIRRMCQAFGYQVVKLKRVRIMNITLGKLDSGSYRKVTQAEYQELVQTLKFSTNLSYKEIRDAK